MNLPLFIATRLSRSNEGKRKSASRPAVKIAIIGVAIGLAVMIIAVGVVLGFKHTIRNKAIGFAGHIRITNFLALQSSDPYNIGVDSVLMARLDSIKGIEHIQRFSLTQGILKTDSDFLGVIFKGVGPEYNLRFLGDNLKSGALPDFSDSMATNSLLISQIIADKLHLRVGDRVFTYFISFDNVKVRRFTVKGIYETNLTHFDQSLCFTDIYTVGRINAWQRDQCSGIELDVTDFSRLSVVDNEVIKHINRSRDRYGNTLTSQTIMEAYPQIFSWLELLDMNVWIILILMLSVASVTMISGLLIIILERTQMIGLLKALGARGHTIRHTFLWLAAFIIARGMLIGDIAGVGLCLIQRLTGVVRLDPSTYYVSKVPIELNIPLIIALNVSTLLICLFVLIVPSLLITRIHPARIMRYE